MSGAESGKSGETIGGRKYQVEDQNPESVAVAGRRATELAKEAES